MPGLRHACTPVQPACRRASTCLNHRPRELLPRKDQVSSPELSFATKSRVVFLLGIIVFRKVSRAATAGRQRPAGENVPRTTMYRQARPGGMLLALRLIEGWALQRHKLAAKSSVETSAWRRRPASVPTFSSVWSGTTHPSPARRMRTWLPLCRAFSKPNLCSARTAYAPETRGSLGIGWLGQ